MRKDLLIKVSLGMASLGLLVLARPALARTDACADDKQKLCSDVDKTDRKAMGSCLKQHDADLSDGCKQQMAKMKNRHKKKSQDSSSSTPSGSDSSTTGSAQ